MKRLGTKEMLVAIVPAAVLAIGVGYGIVVAAESPATDCLVGIQNEDLQQLSGLVDCVDGTECDADGAADGTCTFRIRGALNIPAAGCTPRVIKKAKFKTQKSRGLIVITPVTGQASSVFGSFVDFQVPVKQKGNKPPKPGKRKVQATAKADGQPKANDKDKATLQCTPGGGGGTTTTTLPGNCPPNTAGGPDQVNFTVGATGNDLDTGYTGQSHNFLNVMGGTLSYCLTNCDGGTDTVCDAAGSTGNPDSSLNGPTFGAPLPLFSAGVAVCVVNLYQDSSIQAVVDVATGSFDATATPLRLNSQTYQGTANQVCPRCVNNRCDSGRNQGQNCTVDGSVVVNNPPNVNNVTYNLSKSCLPLQSALLGTPNVVLPLTTQTSTMSGTASGNFPCPGQTKHDECGAGTCTVDCAAKSDPKGGINQTCCTSGAQLPCFPTDPNEAAGQFSRTGSASAPTPALPDPTYPKNGPGTLAAAFCIPATTSTAVDATAGLPGPGASLISGTASFLKAP